MNTPHVVAMALPLLLLAAPAHAQTQSWDYKSYPRDRQTGQYLKDKFNLSTITVEEKDGRASFRMITPGRGDPCFSRGDLPAVVERGPETTTITVTPELAGCEPFRYVIKNDGTGGVRMNLRNERWVPDGLDHGLTRKQ
jgi:hypothetical protein